MRCRFCGRSFARARVAKVRKKLRTRAEKTAFEAMHAHDAEAVIVHERMAIHTTIELARTMPRPVRVFVRREMTSSYPTPHDPRFVVLAV